MESPAPSSAVPALESFAPAEPRSAALPEPSAGAHLELLRGPFNGSAAKLILPSELFKKLPFGSPVHRASCSAWQNRIPGYFSHKRWANSEHQSGPIQSSEIKNIGLFGFQVEVAQFIDVQDIQAGEAP